jgi:hypothetical protein
MSTLPKAWWYACAAERTCCPGCRSWRNLVRDKRPTDHTHLEPGTLEPYAPIDVVVAEKEALVQQADLGETAVFVMAAQVGT